ncbi:hypothetical protein SLA2020_278150 [Shorea laevis]
MSWGDNHWNPKAVLLHGLKNDSAKYSAFKGVYVGKRHLWLRKYVRSIAFMFGLMGFFLLFDSLLVSIFDLRNLQHHSTQIKSSGLKEEDRGASIYEEKSSVQMHGRLLNLASSAIAEKEFKQESSMLWEEPYRQASAWKPCADRKVLTNLGKFDKNNGYILISANGGLNQQRVAICNAVAVASLLNATLVLPRFLYSNVWNDPRFESIYEIIVKIVCSDWLLVHHQYCVAVALWITDADLVKEAKPIDYIRHILPLLLRNGVVHFLGFGNRLGFDPLPSKLQRLRCKCNFHALKFVPKIQQVGSLLVRRIRKYGAARNMVAYSLCEFGGGENERKELQAYREIHFPLLIERLKNSSLISPAKLRKLGRCPLTPEEAALVLAGLGFKRGTYIYLAGFQIYGGKSRMDSFTSLYPNLVTKETLLTPDELAPLRNFSSQLAALDFIACATADVFAMTDSGSQLSSLVSGFRTYYGGGHAPTLRPNKKRLAAILSENSTIGWNSFEDRVKKMIEEGQRVRVRGFGRSIYRVPRCDDCMCKAQ